MARDYPEDMVGWRAGDASSVSYIRKGIVTEIPPGNVALGRTKAEGGDVIQESGFPRAGRLNVSNRRR